MPVINCICIKYGTAYGADYVNKLRAGLARNTKHDLRFLCMTDDASGIDARVEVLPLPDEPFAERMEQALRTAPKRGRLKRSASFAPI